MIHKTKRFFQKIGISAYRLLQMKNGEKNLEFSSEKAKICRNLIRRKDSVLLISPLSNKRFIRNESLGLFVVFCDSKLSIINHSYKYDLDITLDTYKRLVDIFDHQVETRRSLMEEEINSNVKHSLEIIYQKLLSDEKV